jgi:hypothetical protein
MEKTDRLLRALTCRIAAKPECLLSVYCRHCASASGFTSPTQYAIPSTPSNALRLRVAFDSATLGLAPQVTLPHAIGCSTFLRPPPPEGRIAAIIENGNGVPPGSGFWNLRGGAWGWVRTGQVTLLGCRPEQRCLRYTDTDGGVDVRIPNTEPPNRLMPRMLKCMLNKKAPRKALDCVVRGGESGIRTHGGLTSTPVFLTIYGFRRHA